MNQNSLLHFLNILIFISIQSPNTLAMTGHIKLYHLQLFEAWNFILQFPFKSFEIFFGVGERKGKCYCVRLLAFLG